MVLIFALNGKPASQNTAKRKQQTNRLPILTANRRDTPLKTQKGGILWKNQRNCSNRFKSYFMDL